MKPETGNLNKEASKTDQSKTKNRKSKRVYPAKLEGSVSVPGDKSISQRVAMLASLADGTSKVTGYLMGEDAKSTLSAMEQMGAKAEFKDDALYITGVAGKLQQPAEPLNMGNSGTGTRLLAGIVAGAGVEASMIGDDSLSSRPMGRIRHPLEQMGASIGLTGKKGTLPMMIMGGNLKGIGYLLPMASAQVKSCVLLAGLFAEGKTTVVEPRPTRDHTEKLFQALDIPIEINGLEISVQGTGKDGVHFQARDFTVPGDFSSAAFWIVAVAARPGAELVIENVGLNPRRTALLDVMKRMGADIEVTVTEAKGDPIGNIRVRGAQLQGTVIEGDEIPNLIDEIPIICVAGALAEGQTEVRDAAELRVKESDRIAEMVKNLKLFGVQVEEKEDGMVVTGPNRLVTPDAVIDSHGDHRIAMSAAILNSFATGPITIDQVDCVDTSYPEFWQHLEQLGGKTN
ncbi:3-phosphoshikimate 1-carboxyvinyltransferase [Pontiella agarivorans]|uniref:3-phosphoshikimate 1-carboxyvinyltransferase n=1 Tax=Pontiella agarivorans TaxID=3038953 RepID=A0ABU5MTN6_9BACT|nr:3-phosphoshikimate 1-carboxyvinyltransferase [Pontiella agarivorans]MDZ8117512.1 3-phosphoshikimate 1-carboxyvinyltransferase [Pontiella agarivorans]